MAKTIRFFSGAALTVSGLALALGSGQVRAEGEQAQQFTPEFRELHKGFDAKHSPKIDAPASVSRGTWFNVTVSVGSGSQHPSLSEHAIRYIALYKDSVEIARAYLHPVYSAPTVTFSVALDESGSLRALAEPNHSAAWEVSKKITVVP